MKPSYHHVTTLHNVTTKISKTLPVIQMSRQYRQWLGIVGVRMCVCACVRARARVCMRIQDVYDDIRGVDPCLLQQIAVDM